MYSNNKFSFSEQNKVRILALTYEEYMSHVEQYGKPAEQVKLEAKKLDKLINGPIAISFLELVENTINQSTLPKIVLNDIDYYKMGKGRDLVNAEEVSLHKKSFQNESSDDNKERLELLLRTLIDICIKEECLDTRFVLFPINYTVSCAKLRNISRREFKV